jgi:pentatricopeptide repeat protein
LKACGSIGAIDKGKQIHNEIMSRGLLEKDIMLGMGLIDMYAKCGALGKAQEVLTGLPRQDVITWNALVSGYAQQRLGAEALNCFQAMQKQSISPDEVTFLCVLTSCCHSGLLNEAEVLFGNMQKQYGLTPKIEHYTCMVVVFGSAGLFDKALSLIQVMPSSENPAVWLALLGACRKWGNVELGTLAFDQTVQLDNSCIAAYVLMANTFIAAGMREDAEKVEAMRLKYTACLKHQGTSVWVDMSGNMHSFPLKDTTCPQNSRSILKKATDIVLRMSQNGYVFANLSEKSEILAIACALVNASQEETIYIMNSIPICAECHAAIGIISELERRKITLKDPGSIHVFEYSSCACAAWKT